MGVVSSQRDLLFAWMDVIKTERKVSGFFYRKGINKCVLYGMGKMGYEFYYDIRDDIQVLCALDKNKGLFFDELEIMNPELFDYTSGDFDAIIITVFEGFEDVYDYLRMDLGYDGQLYGIEDVILDEICYYDCTMEFDLTT